VGLGLLGRGGRLLRGRGGRLLWSRGRSLLRGRDGVSSSFGRRSSGWVGPCYILLGSLRSLRSTLGTGLFGGFFSGCGGCRLRPLICWVGRHAADPRPSEGEGETTLQCKHEWLARGRDDVGLDLSGGRLAVGILCGRRSTSLLDCNGGSRRLFSGLVLGGSGGGNGVCRHVAQPGKGVGEGEASLQLEQKRLPALGHDVGLGLLGRGGRLLRGRGGRLLWSRGRSLLRGNGGCVSRRGGRCTLRFHDGRPSLVRLLFTLRSGWGRARVSLSLVALLPLLLAHKHKGRALLLGTFLGHLGVH